jgi:hypothetical protein
LSRLSNTAQWSARPTKEEIWVALVANLDPLGRSQDKPSNLEDSRLREAWSAESSEEAEEPSRDAPWAEVLVLSEAKESLETSEEVFNNAKSSREVPSPPLDAPGLESWREPDSWRDSDLAETTAQFTKPLRLKERFAPWEELELFVDSNIRTEPCALWLDLETDNGLDALPEEPVWKSSEDLTEEVCHALDIDKEEELSPDAQEEEPLLWEVPVSSEDGEQAEECAPATEEEEELSPDALLEESAQVEPSESGWDKDKDALRPKEDRDNGPSANGSETGRVPRLSEDSEREPTNALSGDLEREPEPSAGTWELESSEDSSETVRTALSVLDQVSEMSDAEVVPEEESSESSEDKAKDALLTEEETTSGLDAHGSEDGDQLSSSEDSTEVLLDALSGNSEKPRRPSAGPERLASPEDSSEMDSDSLSGERLEDNGSKEQEPEFPEESSESTSDKVKDASLTEEETTDGLDAHGSDGGEVLRSSRDSERVPTDAPSGEKPRSKELSAGTPRDPSSRDSDTELEDALSTDLKEDNGPGAEDHGDSEPRVNSTSREPRSSRDTWDKVNNALSSEEETINSTDAHGLVPGKVLELSEDSTEAAWDAPPGERERTRETSAGKTNQELSEDSETREVPNALLPVSKTDNGLDAPWEEESSEESEEAEESSDGHSEDSTSKEPESSRDSEDKDKDALPTLEDQTDSLDAAGLETWKEPELWRDLEVVTKNAPSGKLETTREESAGPGEW